MKTDIDKQSRKKIETEINKNLFVEAGAGSGKTFELVKRMVAMVESGIDVSKICTITFTKAAANEFYDRFQKALAESTNPNAKEALNNIDLCFMGTIDSFCNMVLSEHPLEAKIPSNSSVASDDELEKLYKREFYRILQGKEGQKIKDKCERFYNYVYNAEKVFVKGMKTLMNCRNAKFNFSPSNPNEPEDVFNQYKDSVLSLLNALVKHPEAIYTGSKGAKEANDVLVDNIDFLNDSWNDNFSKVIKTIKDIKEIKICKEYEDKIVELGPCFDEYFEPYFTEKKNIFSGYIIKDKKTNPFNIQTLNNYVYNIAAEFMNACVPIIEERLRKDGKLTYFDYLLYLRDLLKEDAGNGGTLINHIYKRHSYYLIDEFQDTDPIQTEVFFYLAAENPNPDWKQCDPKPGSLFIVGDPKQSIYRFKNADVSSFIRTRKIFSNKPHCEVVELTRNFRSSDNMCDWFNKVFTNLLPADSSNQSKYNEIPTKEKCEYKGTLKGAYKYVIQNQKKKIDYEDFEKVATIIDNLIDNENVTIQDKDDFKNGERTPKEPRKVTYKDIMVITPGKTYLAGYMDAFIKHNIPFKVEGKVVFNQSLALVALSYIFNAVANPFDKKAMFAAVNLAGCNITEQEIFNYFNESKNMPATALFTKLLEERRIFIHTGMDNAEYIYYAQELLRQAEISGEITSIKEAAKFIKELIESPGSERCIQLQQDNNKVHIANLHKVKGLEASVVILANPTNKKTNAYSRVDYENDDPQSYIFAFDNNLSTNDFDDEKTLEEDVLISEITRLQYVAATRAANAIIVSAVNYKKDGITDKEMWSDFLEFIEDDIDNFIGNISGKEMEPKEEISPDELYDKAEDESVLNDKTSESNSYSIMRPSVVSLKSVTSSEDDYEDKVTEEVIKSKAKENAALTGTIVHRLMEVLVSSKNTANIDDTIEEILKDYQATDISFKKVLESVAENIRSGGYEQNNGAPKDILTELLSAEEVYCEVPFCCEYKDENAEKKTYWNGVIDVVYAKEGKWHIVDYKTNADPKDLDEKYKEQLKAYTDSFTKMTGKDVDAIIYHIDVL